MGWIIAAALLLGLAFLPLGIRFAYDHNGVRACWHLGPAAFVLHPVSDRKSKTKEKKQQKTSNAQSNRQGGSASDFIPLVKAVLELLVDFRHKLQVDLLELKILLAGGDPADLAQNYGKTWAVVGALWPLLERSFIIKKRDVQVLCDFEGDSTLVTARLDLSVTLGRLVILLCRYGGRIIREFINIRKKKQGGTI